MSRNSFRVPKFVDHVIEDPERGRIVGTLRIKPSGVAWASRDEKKWRRVSLAKFIDFMNQNGKLKEK
jgi:hypothetical protein